MCYQNLALFSCDVALEFRSRTARTIEMKEQIRTRNVAGGETAAVNERCQSWLENHRRFAYLQVKFAIMVATGINQNRWQSSGFRSKVGRIIQGTLLGSL